MSINKFFIFAFLSFSIIAQENEEVPIEDVRDNKIKSLLKPKVSNFIQEDYTKYDNIDVFYSRFTIHSITKKDEIILLKKVYKSLINNGLFCIEVRTIKDPLYGKGASYGKNTFIFNK